MTGRVESNETIRNRDIPRLRLLERTPFHLPLIGCVSWGSVPAVAVLEFARGVRPYRQLLPATSNVRASRPTTRAESRGSGAADARCSGGYATSTYVERARQICRARCMGAERFEPASSRKPITSKPLTPGCAGATCVMIASPTPLWIAGGAWDRWPRPSGRRHSGSAESGRPA